MKLDTEHMDGTTRLGLPQTIRGALFDLDGVLTDTAQVHEAAWRQTFDALLHDLPGQRPFSHEDYLDHVDGKPRFDGVRDFLGSRHIDLPAGSTQDRPSAATMWGLAARKNSLLLHKLRADGVQLCEGSSRYLIACKASGLRRAVVSSSANAHAVLQAAELMSLIEVVVDGKVAQHRHLRGKPAPDLFLAAASQLDLSPASCAVFEDATAGVQAGRAGGFGVVVGLAHTKQHSRALRDAGADLVVSDLGRLL